MKKIIIVFAVALILVIPAFSADYPPKGWTNSITDAIAQAEKENKMLFLDFTGSDWCVWCKKLTAEVFSTKEFQDWSEKNLVKVFIDSPQDKSLVDEKTQMQNQILQQVFGVQGFPTIWLLSSDLKPLLRTGYKEGGAHEYIRHLSEDRMDFPPEAVNEFPKEFRKIVEEYIGPIPE